jgi:hypothetical protein
MTEQGDFDCCIPVGYDTLSEPVTVFWYEDGRLQSGSVARIVLETVVSTEPHSALPATD